MSDRAIAEKAKTNHVNVGRVRKRMAGTGTDVPVDRRVGKDGKTRTVPAKKPANSVEEFSAGFAPAKKPAKPAEKRTASEWREQTPAETQAEVSAAQRKREAREAEEVAELMGYQIIDLHFALKGRNLTAMASEAKLGTTHSQVREVAAWLGALADAMEHRADPAQKPHPVRAAADRAEARAKNTAAPANGLDHLEIPAELRRT